jgi:hypothetical protein
MVIVEGGKRFRKRFAAKKDARDGIVAEQPSARPLTITPKHNARPALISFQVDAVL